MTHSYAPRIVRDMATTYLIAETGIHRCSKCGRGPLGHDGRRVSVATLIWSLVLIVSAFDAVALIVI